MPIDEQALNASLKRLADQTGDGTSLVRALTEVTQACVQIFEVTGSGVMLADEQNLIRYVAASDGPGRIMEIAETECGDGPCMRAFVTNAVSSVPDVTADLRWPRLAAILTRHPVRAVLGVPVRLGGVTVGTLDVYRDHVHTWDASEEAAIVQYSSVVETTLAAALSAQKAQQLAAQLEYALEHRVDVERAVGFLMGRRQIDAVVAFNLLRTSARANRRPIGEVAIDVLTTGQLPPTTEKRGVKGHIDRRWPT